MRPLVLVAALLAAPATVLAADDRVVVSISPTRVTIGPETSATQTIHIEGGNRTAPIVFEFVPGQPPGGFASENAIRRNGSCSRSGPAEYTCTGYGDVTLTYRAYPDMLPGADGMEIEVVASATGARRAYGWIDVVIPPPPTPTETTDPEPDPEPTSTGTTTPSESEDPQENPTTPTTTTSGEQDPSQTPTADPPPTTEDDVPPVVAEEQNGGAGLNMVTVALLVGAPVGLVGLAAGAMVLIGSRRRREGF